MQIKNDQCKNNQWFPIDSHFGCPVWDALRSFNISQILLLKEIHLEDLKHNYTLNTENMTWVCIFMFAVLGLGIWPVKNILGNWPVKIVK